MKPSEKISKAIKLFKEKNNCLPILIKLDIRNGVDLFREMGITAEKRDRKIPISNKAEITFDSIPVEVTDKVKGIILI